MSYLIPYLILIPRGIRSAILIGKKEAFCSLRFFTFGKCQMEQTLGIILGFWERQPQTMSAGLKLLLNLVHNPVHFQTQKGRIFPVGCISSRTNPVSTDAPCAATASPSGLLGLPRRVHCKIKCKSCGVASLLSSFAIFRFAGEEVEYFLPPYPLSHSPNPIIAIFQKREPRWRRDVQPPPAISSYHKLESSSAPLGLVRV